MTKVKKLFENSCYWLTILMPISIILGKVVADINLTIVAILFTVLSLIRKDFKPFQERWFLIALTLWTYLLARSIFSQDIILALKKVVPFIRLPLFALCLQTLISKKDTVHKKILYSLMIVVSFLVIDGYIQYFFGKDLFGHSIVYTDNFFRLTGPFSKQFLGAYVSILSMPLLAISIYFISKKERTLYSILFLVLTYLIVFLSGERSPLLQTTIGLIGITCVLATRNKKLLILFPILGLLILVIMYTFGFQQVINRQFFSTLHTLNHYSESPYGKLWNAGIKIGLENLLFGVGPMHFHMHCETITDFCRSHPHNIYIEFLSETGIIGLSLFVYLFYEIIRDFLVNNKKGQDQFIKALALGIMVAIIIRLLPMPSSGFFKNWYAVQSWFMIGWLLSLGKSRHNIKNMYNCNS